MNKKHELFNILKELKVGDKMVAEAYDEILLLFGLVGQSEKLVCDKCDDDGWVVRNEGDIISRRLCNCDKAK